MRSQFFIFVMDDSQSDVSSISDNISSQENQKKSLQTKKISSQKNKKNQKSITKTKEKSSKKKKENKVVKKTSLPPNKIKEIKRQQTLKTNFPIPLVSSQSSAKIQNKVKSSLKQLVNDTLLEVLQ